MPSARVGTQTPAARCYRDHPVAAAGICPQQATGGSCLFYNSHTPLVVDQAPRTDNDQEKNSVKEPEIGYLASALLGCSSWHNNIRQRSQPLVQGLGLCFSRASGEADVVFTKEPVGGQPVAGA